MGYELKKWNWGEFNYILIVYLKQMIINKLGKLFSVKFSLSRSNVLTIVLTNWTIFAPNEAQYCTYSAS